MGLRLIIAPSDIPQPSTAAVRTTNSIPAYTVSMQSEDMPAGLGIERNDRIASTAPRELKATVRVAIQQPTSRTTILQNHHGDRNLTRRRLVREAKCRWRTRRSKGGGYDSLVHLINNPRPVSRRLRASQPRPKSIRKDLHESAKLDFARLVGDSGSESISSRRSGYDSSVRHHWKCSYTHFPRPSLRINTSPPALSHSLRGPPHALQTRYKSA